MSFKWFVLSVLVIGLSLIEGKSVKFVDSNGNLHNLENEQGIDPAIEWGAWASYDNSVNRTG